MWHRDNYTFARPWLTCWIVVLGAGGCSPEAAGASDTSAASTADPSQSATAGSSADATENLPEFCDPDLADLDGDGVLDKDDIAPNFPNRSQSDIDQDGIADELEFPESHEVSHEAEPAT